MGGSKRFSFEKAAKLDSDERRAHQPPDRLASLVAEGAPSTVLEIGVGTGYFALPIARHAPRAVVVGLDVQPEMLELFATRAAEEGLADRTRTVEGAVDRDHGIALDDGTVDAAVMANLYHELDDRPAALAEVRRVLAPGGRLFINDWDPDAPTDTGPPADHRLAADLVERELSAAGFEKVEKTSLYEGLYTFVAS